MDQTRQLGPIEQIRADHVKRYLFAAERLKNKRVLDLACGCGYGSWLLHGAGNEVTGVDISSDALLYAEKHYQGPTYLRQRAEETKGEWDALVCFETLEHLHDPLSVLQGIKAKTLIASVPNEVRFPFSAEKFDGDEFPHQRHYTPFEFYELLWAAGYTVNELFCQKTKTGDVVPGLDGLFLIAVGSHD